MNDKTHYKIYPWMSSKLKLKGLKKEVFAVIYGFSSSKEKGCYYGGLSGLERVTGGTRTSVSSALKYLEKNNLILKSKKGMGVIPDNYIHNSIIVNDMLTSIETVPVEPTSVETAPVQFPTPTSIISDTTSIETIPLTSIVSGLNKNTIDINKKDIDSISQKTEKIEKPKKLDNSKIDEKKEVSNSKKIPQKKVLSDMEKAWSEWIEYKWEQFKFKYKQKSSEDKAKNILWKMSKKNTKNAIEIIDYTIGQGWMGFQLTPDMKKKDSQKGYSKSEYIAPLKTARKKDFKPVSKETKAKGIEMLKSIKLGKSINEKSEIDKTESGFKIYLEKWKRQSNTKNPTLDKIKTLREYYFNKRQTA